MVNWHNFNITFIHTTTICNSVTQTTKLLYWPFLQTTANFRSTFLENEKVGNDLKPCSNDCFFRETLSNHPRWIFWHRFAMTFNFTIPWKTSVIVRAIYFRSSRYIFFVVWLTFLNRESDSTCIHVYDAIPFSLSLWLEKCDFFPTSIKTYL